MQLENESPPPVVRRCQPPQGIAVHGTPALRPTKSSDGRPPGAFPDCEPGASSEWSDAARIAPRLGFFVRIHSERFAQLRFEFLIQRWQR